MAGAAEMATLFPTTVAPDVLGSPGGSPFGPASVEFGFEVPQGSPGELEALGNGMRNAGGWFGDQLSKVQTSGRLALEAGGGWGGQASSAFSELSGHLIQTLSGNQFACDQAGIALGQLSKALEHAQQATRQALADCVRLHGEMVTQQGAANDAATRASSLEQAANNPLEHPAAVVELNHQATLARGDQTTAQHAANQAEIDLGQAERRGQNACHAYQTEAQGLASKIQAAAGDLRPVDQTAGRAAVSLLGFPGGASVAGAAVVPAVIGNPLSTDMFDPYQPGSLLSAIEQSRYRKFVLNAVDGTVSGGSAYASEQGVVIRQQLTKNANRIIQLDEDIAEVGPNTPDGVMISAIRSAAASETSGLASAARSLGARGSLLETVVAPSLLGVNFAANIAEGKDVTQAAAGTAFSFGGAWIGMQGAALYCPGRTPITEAACSATGAIVGGIGGQAAADQLTSAEKAVNRQLEKAWKDLSQPIGGGGLLGGMSPLMAVNPG